MISDDQIRIFNQFDTAINRFLYVTQQKAFRAHTLFGIMHNLANFQSNQILAEAINELFTPDFNMFQLKQLAKNFNNFQFLKNVFHLKHYLLLVEFVTMAPNQQQQHNHLIESSTQGGGVMNVCDRELIIKSARPLPFNPVNYLMAIANESSKSKKTEFNLEFFMNVFMSEISLYKEVPFSPDFMYNNDEINTDNVARLSNQFIHHNDTTKCINSSAESEMLLYTELAFRKVYSVQNYIAVISTSGVSATTSATAINSESYSINTIKRFRGNYG